MTRDLMFKDEIQQLVADAYAGLDRPDGPGAVFYDPEQLARLPEDARAWMLGVGNPVPHAELRSGEQVVDLGCGAGVDTLLAATEVGAHGLAVGVDMLPAMARRGRALAEATEAGNVRFVIGEMEALPLPDGSVDVVVSNGSVNLAARKSRVLAEAYRVLRPGGRLAVADLTIQEAQLPAEVLTHPSAWAG
jgi:arsenite methyltransferase